MALAIGNETVLEWLKNSELGKRIVREAAKEAHDRRSELVEQLRCLEVEHAQKVQVLHAAEKKARAALDEANKIVMTAQAAYVQARGAVANESNREAVLRGRIEGDLRRLAPAEIASFVQDVREMIDLRRRQYALSQHDALSAQAAFIARQAELREMVAEAEGLAFCNLSNDEILMRLEAMRGALVEVEAGPAEQSRPSSEV